MYFDYRIRNLEIVQVSCCLFITRKINRCVDPFPGLITLARNIFKCADQGEGKI